MRYGAGSLHASEDNLLRQTLFLLLNLLELGFVTKVEGGATVHDGVWIEVYAYMLPAREYIAVAPAVKSFDSVGRVVEFDVM